MVSVPIAIQAITQAIKDGVISQNEIDRRCKKVLAAKYWVGLNHYKPVPLQNLYQVLQSSRAHEKEKDDVFAINFKKISIFMHLK